jgi:hypothetical protein
MNVHIVHGSRWFYKVNTLTPSTPALPPSTQLRLREHTRCSPSLLLFLQLDILSHGLGAKLALYLKVMPDEEEKTTPDY